MEERKCLECGELLKGRSDKKFCSDQCRSSYYNQQFTTENNFIRQVNNILKKNWKILNELNPGDKTTTNKTRLVKRGFNLNYYTSTYTTRNGRIYYFCYNLGYSEIGENKLVLVRKEEYVD